MNPDRNNHDYYPGANLSWQGDPFYDPSAMSDLTQPYFRYQRSEVDCLSEFSLPTMTDATSEWNHSMPPPQMFDYGERMAPSIASDSRLMTTQMERRDIETCKRQLSDVMRLLNSQDARVVKQGTKLGLKVTAKLPLSHIFSSQLVQQLLRTAERFPTPEILSDILSSLQHMAMSHPQVAALITESNGIPVLLNLLNVNNEFILYFVVVIVHHILISCESAYPILRKNLGLFIPLLRQPNVRFLSITVDCIQIMCRGNSEAKRLIFAANGHEELVSLLFANTYEKLLWSIVRLVKVLSVERETKSQLIRAGVVAAICRHLQNDSDRFVQNAVSVLRNISDEVLKMPGMGSLMGHLLRVLEREDPLIAETTLCVLMNLTCTNQENRVALIREGGINSVIRCLRFFVGVEKIVEPSVGILRLMSCRGPQGELLRTYLLKLNGFDLIRRAFEYVDRNYAIMKHLVYLSRSLSSSAACVNRMVSTGVVGQILDCMNRVFNALSQGVTDIPAHNVNLELLLENSLGVLQNLAREDAPRRIIMASNCLYIFVQILFSDPSDEMISVTCGLLFELFVEQSAVEYIRQFDIVSVLRRMLEDKDDPIYTYISTILFKLGDTY